VISSFGDQAQLLEPYELLEKPVGQVVKMKVVYGEKTL
jgi:hypothetical protein